MTSFSFRNTDFFTRRTLVYAQIVLWGIVFSLYLVLKEYPASYTGASLFCIVLQEVLELAIPCYTQTLLIVPLFRRKKWLAGFVAYVVQIVVLVYGLPYVLNGVGAGINVIGHLERQADWRQEHISFSVVAFTIVATAVKLASDRLIHERERRQAELRQLKEQLNPHFLFNTLNNLYGLAVVKSEKLPTLMLKLSDLLRYSLYETGQDYVPLNKELNYLTDYLELEKIRLEEKTRIQFRVEGSAGLLSISPLVMIAFVENAFKHISAPRNESSFIDIGITIKDDTLQMSVRNSLDPFLYLQKSKEEKKPGIGMSNVRERLRFLYPHKHSISVTHVPEYYDVDLKIRLTR